MKTKEELKEEQYDLKAKLHEMIEFIHSKDYYTLSIEEISVVYIQMACIELYLNCLTYRLYGDLDELNESDFETNE
jgi:hypothetical protein